MVSGNLAVFLIDEIIHQSYYQEIENPVGNQTSTRNSRNSYLLIVDWANLKQWLVEVDTPLDFALEDVIPYGDDKSLLHFQNKQMRYDFVEYQNNVSYPDAYAISGTFFASIKSQIANLAPMNNATIMVTGSESISETMELPKFNLSNILWEEQGKPDSNDFQIRYGLNYIRELGYTKIFVDSQGRIHIFGRGKVFSNAEGNSIGLNRVDYKGIDPTTNSSVLWDLFAVDEPPIVKFLQLNQSTFAFTFVGPDHHNLFQKHELWNLSPTYNSSERYDWNLIEYVNVGLFQPFSPTLQNFMQFNETISQTPLHTIKYPRPNLMINIPETQEIPGYARYSLFASQSNLFIAISMFQTETGISPYLKANDGIGYQPGSSLILLKVDTFFGLNYTGFSVVLGPDKPFKDVYDSVDDFPNSQQFRGWSIESIFGVLDLQNSFKILVFGSYSELLYRPSNNIMLLNIPYVLDMGGGQNE